MPSPLSHPASLGSTPWRFASSLSLVVGPARVSRHVACGLACHHNRMESLHGIQAGCLIVHLTAPPGSWMAAVLGGTDAKYPWRQISDALLCYNAIPSCFTRGCAESVCIASVSTPAPCHISEMFHLPILYSQWMAGVQGRYRCSILVAWRPLSSALPCCPARLSVDGSPQPPGSLQAAVSLSRWTACLKSPL